MRAVWIAAAIVSLMGALVTGADSAAAATNTCSPSDSVSGVPVVLVHGWTSSSEGMRRTAEELSTRLGEEYTLLQFDYRNRSTEWPDGETADCLARFVVAAWTAAGKHEKVVVVGHSMGGIAARFAAVKAVDGVSVASVLAGVVTLGTPHQGSPWGGTDVAALLEQIRPGTVPTHGSSAATCLAPIDRRSRNCAGPPYLPANVRITQIATQISVKRTLFNLGFVKQEAEIMLWGDGIVTQDSAAGYLGSPPGPRPQTRIELETVSCQYSSDYLMSARFGAKLGSRGGPVGAIIGAEIATLGHVMADAAALDALERRRPTPAIVELSTYAALTPCFHAPPIGFVDGLPVERRVMDRAAEAIMTMRTPYAPVAAHSTNYRLTGDGFDGYFFISPSGNFQCAIRDPSRGLAGMAGCHGETSPIPVQPDRCPEGIGWGFGMQVLPLAQGSFPQVDYLCASELVYGHPSRQVMLLPYGQSITAHGFTCTSNESGIRCEHNSSGHGFRIARNSNEIF